MPLQGLEPLDEWPPFPREQVRPALDRSLWMSLRDLATLTVRYMSEYCTVSLQLTAASLSLADHSSPQSGL